jgi:hypothetical protein
MFVACPSDNAVKLALKLSMFDAKFIDKPKSPGLFLTPQVW